MFGRELFVVFPDDVVDVAGEAGVAAGEAVGRKPFGRSAQSGRMARMALTRPN